MKKPLKSRKGFTLVELLVVIGILAALSVAAVVAFSGMVESSRRSGLNSDANMLVAAVSAFNADVGMDSAEFIDDLDDLDTTNGVIVLVTPDRPLRPGINHTVSFSCVCSADRAISVTVPIEDPDGDVIGFRVDASEVSGVSDWSCDC